VNDGIELHDSDLAAITCSGEELVVSLSPAYIHRTTGSPGVDPGTGWLQPATLTFRAASLISSPALLPATISDGFLRIGSEQHSNVIPAGGAFTGLVELSLVLTTGEALIIHGQSIRIQLHGEPSFVENFG
jgi:hypothetical protein